MTHPVLSLDRLHRPLARIEEMPLRQPLVWLAAGWSDLTRVPAASIGYGVLFTLLSYLMTLTVVLNQLFYLLLPLLSGFFLVAPALGIGLYEMSRQLERGETPSLLGALEAVARIRFQLTLMGVFVALVFLAWIAIANLIFLGLGSGSAPTPGDLFSAASLTVLATAIGVGGVFALAIFALTAVSVPMLLDRPDLNVPSAMQVSVAACLYNWRPMLLWAILIVLLVLGGFLTLYVGLAIAFPLLGHATWHAYRDLVRR